MAILSQLIDPQGYRRCDWDLRADAAGRARWCGLFRWHLNAVVIPMVRAEYPATSAERLAEFRDEYIALFDGIEAEPERFERLDIIVLTEVRDAMQNRYGFSDPFRGLKQRENAAALELLPGVLAEIDATPAGERLELLARGLMAGNIVDLGSKATIERHHAGETAFRETRASQPARPWRYDDLAVWQERAAKIGPVPFFSDGTGSFFRHVVFFVDNAGADVVLGCLPLARWMVQQGARVTLAANSGPALNDITAPELSPLLARAAELDPILDAAVRDGHLDVAATGGAAPLLDLTALTPEFVELAAGADLLLLHGMGRSVESNFHARFTCDVLRTAVLKDEGVAARVGARLYDCMFRFTPGEG